MTVHFGNPPAPTKVTPPARPQVNPVNPPTTPAAPAQPAGSAPAPAASAPADQVQVLPADQRKCADFDPTSGICQDTSGPPQSREEVAAALTSQGLPAAEIEATLSYLDRQGADYQDIGKLVQNQFSFKRDANDVLGAVQAYGIMLEGRALKIAGTGGENPNYQAVMDGLKDGRVRIDKDTERKMGTAEGHYKLGEDTVDLDKSFKIDSAYGRSFLFHELIHTRQDAEHETGPKPLFHDAEMQAYQAQAEFLVKNKVDPNGPDLKGHEILQPAMKIVRLQKYEHELKAGAKPPDKATVEKIHDAIQQATFDMEYALDSHYDTVRDEVPADGLHHFHH